MILAHHDLRIHLNDSGWVEAEMASFVPAQRAFRATGAKGEQIFEARIEEVAPLRRNPGVGIFNDNEKLTARQRVLRILMGFRENAAIPPVRLVRNPPGSPFHYKIHDGSHRFYCSLAAGFSHVPATEAHDFGADI